MAIRYELIEGELPDSLEASLLDLHELVFSGQSRADVQAEIHEQYSRNLLTCVALDGEQVVGYKMGYLRKKGHFYSWLGCVNPNYRRQGIAENLMQQQHDWCRQKAFQTIRTQTRNQWRDMLILNLRHGFNIIGTLTNADGVIVIVLEKPL